MIKVDKVIIVEGKYDKIKLSSIVDAVIIETDGFGIFKDKDKQRLIRKLAQTKGIVVLTDSDSAGFKIRSFISSIVPPDCIVNAYIPDIFGKEKRKDAPSKEGKLGVEGVNTEVISAALNKVGIGYEKTEDVQRKCVTNLDFFQDGLSGTENSKQNRRKLLAYLELPERMSAKGLLDVINLFFTYDEYKQAVINSREVML